MPPRRPRALRPGKRPTLMHCRSRARLGLIPTASVTRQETPELIRGARTRGRKSARGIVSAAFRLRLELGLAHAAADPACLPASVLPSGSHPWRSAVAADLRRTPTEPHRNLPVARVRVDFRPCDPGSRELQQAVPVRCRTMHGSADSRRRGVSAASRRASFRCAAPGGGHR